MAKETKNIRISAEAHRWVTRICGLTGESKSECASRVLLAALPADWDRLAADIEAERRGGEAPPAPGAGPPQGHGKRR